MSKIGFTCGAFDLFHAGHVLMLAECKKHCDRLLVGLQTDPTIDRSEKSKPIQSVLERGIQLKACRYVDDIIVYETEADLENLLNIFEINIRFIGEDHKGDVITGEEICKKRGIEIYFNERKHNFSTTNLVWRIRK